MGRACAFVMFVRSATTKKWGKIRSKEKKTQKNNVKQQKKTLFYAIFIVKNFSNQKQKLTSKLATIAQCSTGEYPVK